MFSTQALVQDPRDPDLELAWFEFLKAERKEGARTTHTWALRVIGVLMGSKCDRGTAAWTAQ